jgi:acetyl esterase/lipase
MSRDYLRAPGPGESAGGPDFVDPLLALERGERAERKLPPFFVPCGDRDPLIDDSRRLCRALELLGIPCTGRIYEGEGHAFHALVHRAAARRCWRDIHAFLDQLDLEPASRSRDGLSRPGPAGNRHAL